MRVLNYIPCKSISKRIPKKNIKLYGFKRLIDYTIDFAKYTQNEILVSSDSKEILNSVDVKYKHLRDKRTNKINKTNVSIMQTLYEDKFFENFDMICLLQPTHPLRRICDYKALINIFKEHKNQIIVSAVLNTENKQVREGSFYFFPKSYFNLVNQRIIFKLVTIGIPVKLDIDEKSDEIFFHKLLNNSEELRLKGVYLK